MLPAKTHGSSSMLRLLLIPSVVLISFVGFSADSDGSVTREELATAFGDAQAGDQILKDCDANADGTHLANCLCCLADSGISDPNHNVIPI